MWHVQKRVEIISAGLNEEILSQLCCSVYGNNRVLRYHMRVFCSEAPSSTEVITGQQVLSTYRLICVPPCSSTSQLDHNASSVWCAVTAPSSSRNLEPNSLRGAFSSAEDFKRRGIGCVAMLEDGGTTTACSAATSYCVASAATEIAVGTHPVSINSTIGWYVMGSESRRHSLGNDSEFDTVHMSLSSLHTFNSIIFLIVVQTSVCRSIANEVWRKQYQSALLMLQRRWERRYATP